MRIYFPLLTCFSKQNYLSVKHFRTSSYIVPSNNFLSQRLSPRPCQGPSGHREVTLEARSGSNIKMYSPDKKRLLCEMMRKPMPRGVTGVSLVLQENQPNYLPFPALILPFLLFKGTESSHRLPWWLTGTESCQHRRRGFDPWVEKIPWRREYQPTPVFLPGKFHGQRKLVVMT